MRETHENRSRVAWRSVAWCSSRLGHTPQGQLERGAGQNREGRAREDAAISLLSTQLHALWLRRREDQNWRKKRKRRRNRQTMRRKENDKEEKEDNDEGEEADSMERSVSDGEG